MATAAGAELAGDDLLRVATAVRAAGIPSIKLTGGDPALYDLRATRSRSGMSARSAIACLRERVSGSGVMRINCLSSRIFDARAPSHAPLTRVTL